MGTEGSVTWRHSGAACEGAESREPGGTSRFPARPLPLIVLVVTGLDTKSCPTLVTPRTGARQAPLSVGFPREGYWSGLPFASPGDLPNPGIEPSSFVLQILYILSH